MYSQSQQKTLDLLDKYFNETPENTVKADIQAVTELSFVGSSAKDYFSLFHTYLNYDPFKRKVENTPVPVVEKHLSEFRTYKEMDITYQEVIDALLRLGFVNESDAERFYYVHKKTKAIFVMPQKPVAAKILKAHLSANSYGLWATGLTKNINDFAKMIENNRLAVAQ
jgi:hypothetical protein